MFTTKHTSEEIENELDQAKEIVDSVGTRFDGMSYEDGVVYALEWVLGFSKVPPITDTYEKDE